MLTRAAFLQDKAAQTGNHRTEHGEKDVSSVLGGIKA